MNGIDAITVRIEDGSNGKSEVVVDRGAYTAVYSGPTARAFGAHLAKAMLLGEHGTIDYPGYSEGIELSIIDGVRHVIVASERVTLRLRWDEAKAFAFAMITEGNRAAKIDRVRRIASSN